MGGYVVRKNNFENRKWRHARRITCIRIRKSLKVIDISVFLMFYIFKCNKIRLKDIFCTCICCIATILLLYVTMPNKINYNEGVKWSAVCEGILNWLRLSGYEYNITHHIRFGSFSPVLLFACIINSLQSFIRSLTYIRCIYFVTLSRKTSVSYFLYRKLFQIFLNLNIKRFVYDTIRV